MISLEEFIWRIEGALEHATGALVMIRPIEIAHLERDTRLGDLLEELRDLYGARMTGHSLTLAGITVESDGGGEALLREWLEAARAKLRDRKVA